MGPQNGSGYYSNLGQDRATLVREDLVCVPAKTLLGERRDPAVKDRLV